MRRKQVPITVLTLVVVASLAPHRPSHRSLAASHAGSMRGHPAATPHHPGEVLPRKGPELERWFFARWHGAGGPMLRRAELDAIWRDLGKRREVSLQGLGWQPMGPNGIFFPDYGASYSGRVLDLEFRPDGLGLRVAAASGGLWETDFLGAPPVPLTEDLTSQAAATFATHPADPSTILLGTGEPILRTGTGLWKTTNGGLLWQSKTMAPEPAAFYRVRYAPDASVVHAVTTSGYYRSTNAGETWTRTLAGVTTDIAFAPAAPNVLFVPVEGSGLWRSIDAGQTWNRLTGPGLPATGNRRGAVAIAASNPSRVYVAFADSTFALLGVYRSDSGGEAWSNVSPPVNYMGNQGWYDNVITVSPVDPDFVAVGGVQFWYSTQGGSQWTVNTSAHLHVDHHAFTWNATGTQLWSGNDGGLSFSNDRGASWHSSESYLPITQFYHIGVGGVNAAALGGGSQDNGIVVSNDGGATWLYRRSGDGAGIAFDPTDSSRVWCTASSGAGTWAFLRHRSSDLGATWTDITPGLDPDPWSFPEIRTDGVSPVYIYTNGNAHVYESTDYGNSWTKLNASPFPVGLIWDISVTRWVPPRAVVYACLSSNVDGQRLRVYDTGSWHERSTGLTSSFYVEKVAVHPTSPDTAWALLDGYGVPGPRIFVTVNRGQTWTNITGDLPDIHVSDLVPHPTNSNVLHIGTEFGCYRTQDGGATWQRWNLGLPRAAIVTELAWIDRRDQGESFYIVAGTYGRGVWYREVSESDPVDVHDGSLTPRAWLTVCRPHPLRGRGVIELGLPAGERGALGLYRVDGRRAAVLWQGVSDGGRMRVTIDGRHFARGVYFCRLEWRGEPLSRKLVIP